VTGRRLDARRLGLVLDRLESPHDGEKLAAIAAAGRILRAGGSTWRDLLAGLNGNDHASTSRVDDVDEGEPVEAPHFHQVRELMLEGRYVLTRWERDFLTCLLAFRTLSEKQRRTLDEIGRKVEAAAAWCSA
jgi:hypothetical protein